jgi:UDP-3-O-[3-hydroxymyristoyl] N-acetylglucosamine deacetylase
MDGLPTSLTGSAASTWHSRHQAARATAASWVSDSVLGPMGGGVQQRTLASAIGCVGIGLHSGRKVSLVLSPAPAGAGIVFHRADLDIDIPARFDHVVDTRLCTMLGSAAHPQAKVATVEHLMAALAATGITNARVSVDGPELPILDGSAADFVFLIDCAGIVLQDAAQPAIEVLRTIRVEQGDAFCELRPAPLAGLDMSVSIAFDAPAIGRQAWSMTLSATGFRAEIARARTFTLASEVAQLQANGLALGGSLANAVVVDGARVLNPGGLRMADEFVRHKLLDAVGDLALAGAAIRGRFIAHRGGHALNNRLLRALFADDTNWRPAGGETASEMPREMRHEGAALPV